MSMNNMVVAIYIVTGLVMIAFMYFGIIRDDRKK